MTARGMTREPAIALLPARLRRMVAEFLPCLGERFPGVEQFADFLFGGVDLRRHPRRRKAET